ncbi:MAG: aminopeptidase, partial [Ruminococcaceae bacterium]|nr:aminopeptidase [Oscillospiraceae bacterium]
MDNKELREKLFYAPKNGYDRISDEERRNVFKLAEEYKAYLTASPTERDTVQTTIELAEKQGFVPYTRGMELKPGDRVYTVGYAKSIILAVIGNAPMTEGAHILAAHIDSPRLDLKPMPMYEDRKELVYFKTHYYGGVKKYQWVTIPLALRGVVALKGGGVVNVEIGTKPGDPVFTITDLLPHLGKDQMTRSLAEGITGEALNVLIGSIPMKDDEGSDRAKFAILNYLYDDNGITE